MVPAAKEAARTATFAVAIEMSSPKEKQLINRATVTPPPANLPMPPIPGHVKPSAIVAIFDCTARKENATIPTVFLTTRPRNMPSAIGLQNAILSCAADKATPALARADKGRTRKQTHG